MGLVVKILSRLDAKTSGTRTLGLDPDHFDVSSVESIAAGLRRVAGFLCPCPQRVLVEAVVRPLQELIDDKEELREVVENTLEAMLAYGDLLDELEVAGPDRSSRSRLVYAAPPSFVSRQGGSIFLLGIAPDRNSALFEKFEKRILYRNHVRQLTSEVGEDLRAELTQQGLSEVTTDIWLKQAPPAESSAEYLKRIRSKLRESVGTISELTILNSERPVNHYRRRWELAKDQSGVFIARRPQPYGNDLWCYVELQRGVVQRLIDFPVDDGGLRGCDEAWRLQMAIDAERGNPQQFRVVESDSQHKTIEFYSPVPSWASRHWDFVGEPFRQLDSLFAYRFSSSEIVEEIDLMKRRLWLKQSN
jgi:hypothetical protein